MYVLFLYSGTAGQACLHQHQRKHIRATQQLAVTMATASQRTGNFSASLYPIRLALPVQPVADWNVIMRYMAVREEELGTNFGAFENNILKPLVKKRRGQVFVLSPLGC